MSEKKIEGKSHFLQSLFLFNCGKSILKITLFRFQLEQMHFLVVETWYVHNFYKWVNEKICCQDKIPLLIIDHKCHMCNEIISSQLVQFARKRLEEQYAFHLILFWIIKEISNRKKIKARNGSEDYIMNDLLIIILPIFIKILRN